MNWRFRFKRRWENQMNAEFEFHLENQIREHMKSGLSQEEAESRARLEFGALDLTKDECRDQRAFEPLDRLFRDLRQALRSLRRTPAFASSAILTLALGIGANTAIFSALHAIVLRPLPYPEPDRLVVVAHYNPILKYPTYLSYPDFLDWQRDAKSFEQMAALTPVGFDLTNPGTPEHVNGYEVSANFFSTLGVNFAVGHAFSPNDDRFGGAPAVVISNRLWRERFDSNVSVIGRSVTLNGSGYFITGVLPPEFSFSLEKQLVDVYTPVGRSNPMFRQDRTNHDILCIARLKPGVSISRAHAEMDTLQEQIDRLNPNTEKGLRTHIVSLKQELVGAVGQTLILLLGAVGFVLLIACANVANLSLARSAARVREFSLRRALGASRVDIIRQLITESVLLSLLGGVVGLLLAKVGLRVVLRAAPGNLPRVDDMGLSIPVLLFAFLISFAVGIAFGLVPALRYSRANLEADLREGARGSTARRQSAQNVLAMVQIALALVLLSGAGLLFRTVNNLWSAKRGFDTQSVITFQIGLSPFVTQTASVTRASYQQLAAHIREIPGVESADLTALVPLGQGDNSGPFWIGTQQPASMSLIPRANWYPTGPDYPRSMRIPLLQGRFLSEADNVHSPLVVLVDSVLAHTYFSGKDPLGQTLTIPHWGSAGRVTARIVGVVGHVEQYSLDSASSGKPQIYYSLYQLPDEALPIFRNEVTFAVRAKVEPGTILPNVRKAVHDVIGDQPVYNIRTTRELVESSIARQRFPMILLAAFSISALMLACVGIYGVLAYSTAQRAPEFGIRMAVGATKWDVIRMLLQQGLRLTVVAVVIGAAAALVLTRVLSSFSHLLYGVRSTDSLTFAAASLALIAAALLACFIPANRAARLDPMDALRHD